MKKRLLIVIALALVFTLALTLIACEPSGSKEQTPQGGAPSTPDGGQTPETPDGGEQTPETPDEGDEGEAPTPPVTYTVTFETNGGSAVKAVTVDEGDAITSAPETKLDGYEFDGWYFSADLSDDALVTFPYTPAESTTLYAKWSKILTAADLYNEVFGEDYEYLSLIQHLSNLAQRINSSNNFVFADCCSNEFILYANLHYADRNITGLLKMTYVGQSIAQIQDTIRFLNEIDKSGFESYLHSIYENYISQGMEVLFEQFNELKNKLSQARTFFETIPINNFTRLGLITNTKTEIEFADYAAKFMPAGVTPIACYVGECGARNIDYKYFVEYFGIGYYSMVKTTLVFMNNDGSIAVSEYEFIVRALNNKEASESIYNRLLNGNETTDYVVSNIDTTTIENPIWTGYTVGVTK